MDPRVEDHVLRREQAWARRLQRVAEERAELDPFTDEMLHGTPTYAAPKVERSEGAET